MLDEEHQDISLLGMVDHLGMAHPRMAATVIDAKEVVMDMDTEDRVRKMDAPSAEALFQPCSDVGARCLL